jgi:F-type H+-transporting ATPase subunit delta
LKTVKGVKKYAKKFLANIDRAEVAKGISQLDAVVNLMKQNRDFRTFVICPVFDKAEMEKALAFICGKIGASPKMGKYLEYLYCEKALGSLPEIVAIINALYLEMQKRAKAIVTSPLPIAPEYEAELKRSLKKVTGRDIDIEFVLDPALLGGVQIRIGSAMYDSSLKGQLGLLRDKFIEG